MITSKKYLLVSLVLGLSVAHGVSAASSSAGVGPRLEGIAIEIAAAPGTGSFTVLTPADLAAAFYPRTATGYEPVELMETKVYRGYLSNSGALLPTAAALLPAIQYMTSERTLPFQEGSAIANVKAAYRALRGLLEYQMYLKANCEAFQRGETAPVKPLNMSALFSFAPSDVDRVEQKDASGYTIDGGYTPLDDLKTLLTGWADESKKLGDILKGNQFRASLGAVEEAAVAAGVPVGSAASAKAVASALVEGLARGAEKAAGTESPSLFNPGASVRDNVVALYRYVAKVRDHIRESYDGYMAERDTKSQADVAAAQAVAAVAQAAAAEAATNALMDRQARESLQGLLDAKKQELAEKERQLDTVEDKVISLREARDTALERDKASAEELSRDKGTIFALKAALAEAQAKVVDVGSSAASAAVGPRLQRDTTGFEELFSEIHSLRADKSAMEDANAELHHTVEQLQAQLLTKDSQISQLRSSLAKITGDNAALTRSLTELALRNRAST